MASGMRALALFGATLIVGGCAPEGDQQQSGSVASPPAAAAQAIPRTPSPAGAAVRFVTPQDGAVVSSPVRVDFAITGMDLVPAGTNTANSGHHHILVDARLPDMNLPIPTDANHLHFGNGSATAELVLAPGEHTLQLLFGDYLHIPHDAPVYSAPISITVE